MAAHNYISDPKNPFFSLEDDVDDETFLGSAPPRTSAPSDYYSNNHFDNYDDELERQQRRLVERRKSIEERTIKSSERSISLLRDSEQIGAATAEELIRQREQLERTEKRLDDINSTLRFSQKHIQGIKSVFGSLRNYLSGKSIDVPPSSSDLGPKIPESESCGSVSTLTHTIDQTRNNLAANHPALQRRGLLGDEEEPRPGINNASAALERNLDEMSGSLARLKGLAIGLSEEIDSQNDLIESVTDKSEKADIMLQRQNKDMAYILKK